MAKPVTFWFEFASSYSYLSALRIEDAAATRGVELIWKPFLLGPIFKSQGWDTSPFSIYEAKGQNMWRDVEQRAAIAALHEPWGRDFCKRVFAAAFQHGLGISASSTIADCIEAAGSIDYVYMRIAYSNTQKQALRENTEAAQTHGIYGAPSFTVGDELFWGDDRLEDALGWANQKA